MVAFREPVPLHDLGPSAKETTLWMALHIRDLFGETVRKRYVILILARYVFPACKPDPHIERSGKTAILMPNQPDSRIFVISQNPRRFICRAIIDDKKLKVINTLGKNVVDRFGDILCAIVNRK